MATNGTQIFELGEIRAATDIDFDRFIHLVEDNDGWVKKLDKVVTVWQKETGHSTIKLVKVCGVFQNLTAGMTFDALMDGEYRRTWDENVIEDYELCRLDDCNDIGYYSMKCPGPLKNRDFVNQRSWRIYSEDKIVLFNHSVVHKDIPPKKQFIRGLSYITGFLLQSSSEGCSVKYITQSDPRGKLPKWIINLAVKEIAPAVYKRLFVAASNYNEWKSQNKPDFKPWRNADQNTLPLVEMEELRQQSTGVTSSSGGGGVGPGVGLNGDQDEETVPEEGLEEFVEHIVESYEQETEKQEHEHEKQ